MKRTLLLMGATVLLSLGLVRIVSAELSYDWVPLPHNGTVIQTIVTDDFDNDGNLDVGLVGVDALMELTVAFGDGNGDFPTAVILNNGAYDRLTSGFVNDDEYPDVIALRFGTGALRVYLSNGDQTFADPIEVVGASSAAYGVTTGYINDDAYLDVIVGGVPVVWYSGDGTGALTYEGTPFGSQGAKSIGLLDLNGDAHTDVILLGYSGYGVRLYLGDGAGGFTWAANAGGDNPFPAQLNRGHTIIDFDEDGNPDILVADPEIASIGDSKAHIIMTDGTGHVKDILSLTVKGTCYGLTAFDFNDDNHLDIAAASSSERRLYLHLGDGSGGIADTLSYSTAPVAIICMSAGDFREDGRWDFAAGDVGGGSSVYLRSDQTPLGLEEGTMTTTIKGDVGLRVWNPMQLLVDDLRFHVPGGRCDYRDVDYDGIVDKRITDLDVQPGTYRVSVWGTAATAGGTVFTLPVDIPGWPLMLARDATPPSEGDTLNFAVYVGAGMGVTPASGITIGTAMPTFDWSNVVSEKEAATVYGIQISDSWDFSSPLYDVNDLTLPRFTPPAALSGEAMYYWRFRAGDGSTWGDYSDLHVVTVSSCTCSHQADIDGDDFLTSLDMCLLVDAMFAGSAADTTDVGCPTTRTDFDSDGFPTSLDLAALIDHLFAGGPGPCDPCYPYQPSCEP